MSKGGFGLLFSFYEYTDENTDFEIRTSELTASDKTGGLCRSLEQPFRNYLGRVSRTVHAGALLTIWRR